LELYYIGKPIHYQSWLIYHSNRVYCAQRRVKAVLWLKRMIWELGIMQNCMIIHC